MGWPAMSVSSSSMCGGDAGMKCVVWFRRDLRVEDNPALAAAARTAGEVVPAYVWSPEEDGPYFPGRVSRWWLSQSLKHLEASLHRLGAAKLVTRRSPDSVAARTLPRGIAAPHRPPPRRSSPTSPANLPATANLPPTVSFIKIPSQFFFKKKANL